MPTKIFTALLELVPLFLKKNLEEKERAHPSQDGINQVFGLHRYQEDNKGGDKEGVVQEVEGDLVFYKENIGGD